MRLSEDLDDRLKAFQAVVESVLEEELSFEAYVELLLRQAMDSMLADLLGPLDSTVVLQSVLQLGARHPSAVYGYVVETLRSGAAVSEREAMRRRLGFQAPQGN